MGGKSRKGGVTGSYVKGLAEKARQEAAAAAAAPNKDSDNKKK